MSNCCNDKQQQKIHSLFQERLLYFCSVWDFVELEGGELDPLPVQHILNLAAERTRGFREHHHLPNFIHLNSSYFCTAKLFLRPLSSIDKFSVSDSEVQLLTDFIILSSLVYKFYFICRLYFYYALLMPYKSI